MNYDTYDKEMLAIIRALEEWRYDPERTQHVFEIWTDHKNLEYFMSAKKLNRRQARWSLFLSRFHFTLHHKPSTKSLKSDVLSRRPDHGKGEDDNSNITLLKPVSGQLCRQCFNLKQQDQRAQRERRVDRGGSTDKE